MSIRLVQPGEASQQRHDLLYQYRVLKGSVNPHDPSEFGLGGPRDGFESVANMATGGPSANLRVPQEQYVGSLGGGQASMTAMKRARSDADTRTEFGDAESLENERRSIVVLESMGDSFRLNSPSGFKVGKDYVRSARNPPKPAERGVRGHEHTREWSMENDS